MSEDWRAEPSAALRLAAWTRLSADQFGSAYVSISNRTAKHWATIQADLLAANPGAGPADLIRAACQEAERAGLLEPLARAVANLELQFRARAEDEIGQLLEVVGADAIMQAMTEPMRSLMNTTILRSLVAASDACALVRHAGVAVGTAFLVERDLVLTAGHVALAYDPPGSAAPTGWLDELRDGLSFRFCPVPTDPDKKPVIVYPAPGKEPVAYSLPYGKPVNILARSLASPAEDFLDFALIRLANRVEHVVPIDIREPDSAELRRRCFVMGYAGGDELKFDADDVIQIDDPSGRLLHRANAIAGMSGGCCLGPNGTAVALHEGSIRRHDSRGGPARDEAGNEIFDNRGISLSAIRKMQRGNGADPLAPLLRTRILEFADPRLVERLYKSGLRLAGPDREQRWQALFQGLLQLPQPPGDGVELPPFHPCLARREIDSWIEGRSASERVCYVMGAQGVGKTFCAQIASATVDHPAVDVLQLTPTQTSVWSWEEAIASHVEQLERGTRTTAGAIRYDDVQAILDGLSRREGAQRDASTPLLVTIDFESVSDGVRFDQSPWLAFIEGLASVDWARTMVIGISEDERDMIDDRLAANPVTEAVRPPAFALQPLGAADLKDYAIRLVEARRGAMGRSVVRTEIDALLSSPVFQFRERAAMQTVEVVCAAMAFERTLGRAN